MKYKMNEIHVNKFDYLKFLKNARKKSITQITIMFA